METCFFLRAIGPAASVAGPRVAHRIRAAADGHAGLGEGTNKESGMTALHKAALSAVLLMSASTAAQAYVMCRTEPGGSVVVDGVVHPSQPIQVCEFVDDPTDGGGGGTSGGGSTGGGGGGGPGGVSGEDEYPEGPAAAFPVDGCVGNTEDREQKAFLAYRTWMMSKYTNVPRQAVQDAKFRAEGATIMLVFWKDGFGTGGIYRRTDSTYLSTHGMLELVSPNCN